MPLLQLLGGDQEFAWDLGLAPHEVFGAAWSLFASPWNATNLGSSVSPFSILHVMSDLFPLSVLRLQKCLVSVLDHQIYPTYLAPVPYYPTIRPV